MWNLQKSVCDNSRIWSKMALSNTELSTLTFLEKGWSRDLGRNSESFIVSRSDWRNALYYQENVPTPIGWWLVPKLIGWQSMLLFFLALWLANLKSPSVLILVVMSFVPFVEAKLCLLWQPWLKFYQQVYEPILKVLAALLKKIGSKSSLVTV